jgi:Tfp pilus assembly protein PilZ
MEDKRGAQRISVFLEIKEIDHKPQDDTFLLNFSETGAKIETLIQYTPGDHLEFIFYLPDKVTAIHRKGDVVWVTPHETKPGRFVVGLELADEWELGRLIPA